MEKCQKRHNRNPVTEYPVTRSGECRASSCVVVRKSGILNVRHSCGPPESEVQPFDHPILNSVVELQLSSYYYMDPRLSNASMAARSWELLTPAPVGREKLGC